MSAIAKLWAKEIIAGRRKIEDAPPRLKLEIEKNIKKEDVFRCWS